MDEFNAEIFWTERVNDSVKHINELYKRNVVVDREYKDGLAKVTMDGKFVAVTRDSDHNILIVLDTIYSMLTIFRDEQINDLQERLSALFD